MFKLTEDSVIVQRRPLIRFGWVLMILIMASLACSLGAAQEATTSPGAPSGLAASLSAANQVTLNWTDNSDNEEGSIVTRRLADSGEAATELGRPGEDAISFVDGAVECGVSYEYFLQAYNAVGTSSQVCVRVNVPEQCTDPAQGVTTGPCETGAEVEETPTPTEEEEPTATTEPEEDAPAATTAAPPPAPTKTNTPIPPTATPEPVCGDGACNGAENASTCGIDCPAACGDEFCTHSENSGSCPGDCPASCGDGVCTSGEDPGNCPDDCPDVCGDSICTGDETHDNCPDDCFLLFFPGVFEIAPWCGDGTCNGDESILSCPDDCQLIFILPTATP